MDRNFTHSSPIIMKLTILFLLISSFAFSQGTVQVSDGTDIKNAKLEYKKIVIITPEQANAFFEALIQWKRLQVYDPESTPEIIVQRIKSIDSFMTELSKTIKVDSVAVLPEKPKIYDK